MTLLCYAIFFFFRWKVCLTTTKMATTSRFVRRLWMPNIRMVVSNPAVRSPNENVRKFEVKVAVNMGKIDIRNFLESVYDVRVLKVNTMIYNGKWKRSRMGTFYRRPDFKKAIVTYATTNENMLPSPSSFTEEQPPSEEQPQESK